MSAYNIRLHSDTVISKPVLFIEAVVKDIVSTRHTEAH
jgi:hypothetical protein